MHELRVQRTLIAFIRQHTPLEYGTWRVELRRQFAEIVAATPDMPMRRYYGRLYRNHKAAMVIATARHISMTK